MDVGQLREALAPIVAKKLLQRCGGRQLIAAEADQLAHEIISLILLQLVPPPADFGLWTSPAKPVEK